MKMTQRKEREKTENVEGNVASFTCFLLFNSVCMQKIRTNIIFWAYHYVFILSFSLFCLHPRKKSKKLNARREKIRKK
jgi:hypothetical protein